jgi:hypothetical protein
VVIRLHYAARGIAMIDVEHPEDVKIGKVRSISAQIDELTDMGCESMVAVEPESDKLP